VPNEVPGRGGRHRKGAVCFSINIAQLVPTVTSTLNPRTLQRVGVVSHRPEGPEVGDEVRRERYIVSYMSGFCAPALANFTVYALPPGVQGSYSRRAGLHHRVCLAPGSTDLEHVRATNPLAVRLAVFNRRAATLPINPILCVCRTIRMPGRTAL